MKIADNNSNQGNSKTTLDLSDSSSTTTTMTMNLTDPAYENIGIPIRELPFVLHYCQRYSLGRWFFSKYKLREDMFDNCTAPLLKEPPTNLALQYDWNIFPNGFEFTDFTPLSGNAQWKEDNKRFSLLRHGWMLCAVLFGINEAIYELKKAKCSSSDSDRDNNQNYFQKTLHFHDEKNFTLSLEDHSNPFQKEKQKKK